jgi:hypothetical protein
VPCGVYVAVVVVGAQVCDGTTRDVTVLATARLGRIGYGHSGLEVLLPDLTASTPPPMTNRFIRPGFHP